MTSESDLRIDHLHFPPFSARNCHQQITTFNPSGVRQTINGNWVSLNADMPIKYQTLIVGKDYSSPNLHHLCPGQIITIHSIQPFVQAFKENHIELLRLPVEGSIKVYSLNLHPLDFSCTKSRVILTEKPSTQSPVFISYRPLLTMTVLSFKMDFQEWGEQNQWALVASE